MGWEHRSMGAVRNSFRSLIRKHDGKRSRGEPRPRWEYNIKIDLKGVGCKMLDCICQTMESSGMIL
jgi:hypothetical protein